jgi:hypothetical protein
MGPGAVTAPRRSRLLVSAAAAAAVAMAVLLALLTAALVAGWGGGPAVALGQLDHQLVGHVLQELTTVVLVPAVPRPRRRLPLSRTAEVLAASATTTREADIDSPYRCRFPAQRPTWTVPGDHGRDRRIVG